MSALRLMQSRCSLSLSCLFFFLKHSTRTQITNTLHAHHAWCPNPLKALYSHCLFFYFYIFVYVFYYILSCNAGYTVVLSPSFFLEMNYELRLVPWNVSYHIHTNFLDVIQPSSHRTISCSKLLKTSNGCLRDMIRLAVSTNSWPFCQEKHTRWLQTITSWKMFDKIYVV